MAVLAQLEPKAVFHYFEEICGIPHESSDTQAISDYLVAFAKERNLYVRQDTLGNVIIKKPATSGYEDAPVVMLQGHMIWSARRQTTRRLISIRRDWIWCSREM